MKTAYINGNIKTQQDPHTVWGFVVDNDTIVEIFEKETKIDESITNVVDLNNKTVLPGLIDSHLHGLLTAQKMRQVDLSPAKSIEDVIKLVKEKLPEDSDEKTWIIGRGWNQDYFKEQRFLEKEDLDKISTKHPIVLIRACIHICAVNSKALEIIDLDPNNLPTIEDGEIYLNDKNELSGLFSESALEYVYQHLPVLSIEEIKELILDFQKLLNSQGITSIHSDDFTALNKVNYETIIKAYQELANEDKLTIKVYQQCLLPKHSDLEDFLNKGYHTKQNFKNYRIGPLKILLDGSLGARTAAIRNGYADARDEHGILTYTKDELIKLTTFAQDNNLQLAIHGIGDAAIENIIEMYERLDSSKENPLRHGIVHCQITDKDLIDRIINNKICIYAQPIFLHYDIHMVEDLVGKELASTSYAFKTIMDHNVSLSLGTDSPVEPTDPFANMYCAIARNDLNQSLKEPWYKHEALTIEQAIKGYTIEGAYQSFEESIKGSISINKKADFIILDRDITKIEPVELLDTKVIATYIDGKEVYHI